jgi:hypothetical protein
MTAPEDPRARFRTMPAPVRPEDTIESLDTSTLPDSDDDGLERDRMLRNAGA